MTKAMVIDDSKAIRLILTKTLTKLGYDVCSAGNGKEALQYLDAQNPELSLFLLDWNMPEMNGLEFLKQVRRRPLYSEVPLMMVTTETEVDQMTQALEAGANEYMMKPFTEDMLTDKLRLMGVLV